MSDDLLLYGNRIIMPDIMKTRDLERYTNGTKEFRNADYQLKTQRGGQAYQRIWTNFVSWYPECKNHAILQREPLKQTLLSNYPWERVASDLKTTSMLVIRLLFWFCGNTEAYINNFHKCHYSTESHLFSPRYLSHPSNQQWTAIYIRGDESVFINIWVHSYYQLPPLPSSKWNGWMDS